MMRSCLALYVCLLSFLAAGCGPSSAPRSDSPTPSDKASPAHAKLDKPHDQEQDASEKKPSDKANGKPKTAAEQYKDLENEYNQAQGKLLVALRQAKTEEEKKGLNEKRQELRATYASRFLELAEKNRNDQSRVGANPATWLALMWFTSNADPGKAEAGFDKAIKIILEDYAQDVPIAGVLRNPDLVRAAERLSDCESRLRTIAEKHTSPEGRGVACLILAQHLKQQAKDRAEGKDPVKLTKEAMAWLERVVDQYGDVKFGTFEGVGPVTLGQKAKEELAALRKWVELIGKAAPEIEGEDIDGKSMKLSDYRGKVVVLSFWFSDCFPCRKMIPDEKALVKRMGGKPFALLGINNDKDRDKAKALVAKEGMTWRSWWDRRSGGAIAAQWAVEGWPTVFVLDHKGIVRYKGALRVNDGTTEKTLEEAVELLLKEIEAKNR